MKVAEDFVNILDHEEDVLAEAEQGNNPAMSRGISHTPITIKAEAIPQG